ncbi:MAG: hypothetical protein AABZ60_01185 [Planctomycetota bacterium]
MVYPKFAFFLVILAVLLLASGCSSSDGGSSQGLFGQVVDCGIGGTSEDPPDGIQFQTYSFTISGIASGVTDPVTGEAGPRPDNFLVFLEDIMPSGLRLDPAGNADTSSDIEVIGSPFASGVQTLRVLVADADNEDCYTTFEFSILVEECDLALVPVADPGDLLPFELGPAPVGEVLSVLTIDRTITIGTSSEITVFLTTEFLDAAGDIFDPLTDFPVPGLTVDIPTVSTGFAPIEISGTPTSTGTFIFTVRVSASAVESDPDLDPGVCVVEQTYQFTIEPPSTP